MHPYKSAPDRSFWSKAVSQNYDASALMDSSVPLIRRGDKVATAGSCFASNLVPHLKSSGFQHLRTENIPYCLRSAPPENMGYGQFSASYGNIYTARQLLQLLRRCTLRFKPVEDRWLTDKGVIDPFRPGLRYYALSNREFDALTQQHLMAVRRAFSEASVFIFTLGLTEAWVSTADGAVFPVCPGTIAGTYSPERHAFKNFSVSEVIEDINDFIVELREINPEIRIILTVSPVPLVATATGGHVLNASSYSKSVLRVAAESVSKFQDGVIYFPSYEIVTSPRSPDSFFESDYRNVSASAVSTVMNAFLAHCECAASEDSVKSQSGDVVSSKLESVAALSERIAAFECEEMMVERN